MTTTDWYTSFKRRTLSEAALVLAAPVALAFDPAELRDAAGKWSERAGALAHHIEANQNAGQHAAEVEDGHAKSQGIIGKYSAKLSALIDRVPVIGTIKRKTAAALAKVHQAAAKRYGPKTAAAIMVSGTVMDLALMGGGVALAGIPIVTGVNQLLGILPAFVLAEGKYWLTGGAKFALEDESELTPEAFIAACHDVAKQVGEAFKEIVEEHKDDLAAIQNGEFAIRRAPAGETTMIGGKEFQPGEFIPGEAWKEATAEEKEVFIKAKKSRPPRDQPGDKGPTFAPGISLERQAEIKKMIAGSALTPEQTARLDAAQKEFDDKLAKVPKDSSFVEFALAMGALKPGQKQINPMSFWMIADIYKSWKRRKDELLPVNAELAVRFVEGEHPRGQPENRGEFVEKGKAAEGEPRSPLAKLQKTKLARSGPPVLRIKEAKRRAWDGTPMPVRNQISKQLAGKIGEDVVIAWLHRQGLKDARHMNIDRNNFPIDLVQNRAVIEVKTGNVANGAGAQQWRLTIGEPGKAEKEALAKMNPEDKLEHNRQKQKKIYERKRKALADLSKQLGKPVKARTITCLINPDTKTVDIYAFDDWHDRIGWKSEAATNAYVGSYTYG